MFNSESSIHKDAWSQSGRIRRTQVEKKKNINWFFKIKLFARLLQTNTVIVNAACYQPAMFDCSNAKMNLESIANSKDSDFFRFIWITVYKND